MASRVYQPGDVVRIRNARYVIERQVLFNRPAYRVRPYAPRRGMEKFSFVVDGVWINTTSDPIAPLAQRRAGTQKVTAS